MALIFVVPSSKWPNSQIFLYSEFYSVLELSLDLKRVIMLRPSLVEDITFVYSYVFELLSITWSNNLHTKEADLH